MLPNGRELDAVSVSVSLSVCLSFGGAENASTGKRMYGKREYESAGMENVSTKNASTTQTFSHIKTFGTSQVSVVYFQVGWASGLQIVFF